MLTSKIPEACPFVIIIWLTALWNRSYVQNNKATEWWFDHSFLKIAHPTACYWRWLVWNFQLLHNCNDASSSRFFFNSNNSNIIQRQTENHVLLNKLADVRRKKIIKTHFAKHKHCEKLVWSLEGRWRIDWVSVILFYLHAFFLITKLKFAHRFFGNNNENIRISYGNGIH